MKHCEAFLHNCSFVLINPELGTKFGVCFCTKRPLAQKVAFFHYIWTKSHYTALMQHQFFPLCCRLEGQIIFVVGPYRNRPEPPNHLRIQNVPLPPHCSKSLIFVPNLIFHRSCWKITTKWPFFIKLNFMDKKWSVGTGY